VAEIKSAVELAMEKTKGMHLSREEKEKIKEEELHAKAQSLVNRFLEVDFHLKEVEKDLGKHHPEQREHLEKLIITSVRPSSLTGITISFFRVSRPSRRKVKTRSRKYGS
jgi:hypothetical protein